jgi:hypothetical protein
MQFKVCIPMLFAHSNENSFLFYTKFLHNYLFGKSHNDVTLSSEMPT